MTELEQKEEHNLMLFKEVSREIYKDKREEDWEAWKFKPEANFFMTPNKR